MILQINHTVLVCSDFEIKVEIFLETAKLFGGALYFFCIALRRIATTATISSSSREANPILMAL